jgi:hypothetical protein
MAQPAPPVKRRIDIGLMVRPMVAVNPPKRPRRHTQIRSGPHNRHIRLHQLGSSDVSVPVRRDDRRVHAFTLAGRRIAESGQAMCRL